MTERTKTTFTCDGCDAEQEAEPHTTVPHGWRRLLWQRGYIEGEANLEAHFCEECQESRREALVFLLQFKGQNALA